MSEPLTRILLIDDDPIFRLGLRAALQPFPDLQVVAEVDTPDQGLEILGRLKGEAAINIVILELNTGRAQPHLLSSLSLCQQLNAEYPNVRILLLTVYSELDDLLTAKASGVAGYCPKGTAITTIVDAIRQLQAGQSAWFPLDQVSPQLARAVRSPSWHHKMRQSGLSQIEAALAQVMQQLQQPDLSNLDWLFWSGRKRELVAARWLVNQLLPTDVIVVEREPETEDKGMSGSGSVLQGRRPLAETRGLSSRQEEGALAALPASLPSSPNLSPLASASQLATPFDVTLAKVQSNLSNLSGVVLEIDILSPERKRDLLYIILRKFQEIVEELRFSQVTSAQLSQKRSLILQDLWQTSLTEFFGKYYTLPIGNQEFELVNILLQDALLVQVAILDKIPLVVELLDHQLFDTSMLIDNVSYPAHTPEVRARAEIILQNLSIQVANAVVQPLLNRFADVESIKQSFYDRSLVSSREITRFRNNLSWRYRLLQLVYEPKAIFESRYDLFVLTDFGIKQIEVYAPRQRELDQLQGIPFAVTLAYEARDAIAPRLRGTVAWAGRGVVYILTQVLGRSIGLIVRGVFQGLGNTLQDTRFRKNGERGK